MIDRWTPTADTEQRDGATFTRWTRGDAERWIVAPDTVPTEAGPEDNDR